MLQGMPLDWVSRHSAGAVRQGLGFDSLMADSLIDIRHGDSRDQVGPAHYLLLCANIAVGVEDAAHGLARDGILPGYSAIGLRAALGSATLESAINAVRQLYGMASRSIRFHLSTQHDHAVLSVEANCARDHESVVLEDVYLSWMFMHCMYFLGRGLPVIEVTSRDPTHFNLGRPHHAIGATVRHGHTTSMRFSKALLAARGTTRAGGNDHWECFKLWLDFVDNGWTDQQPIAVVPNTVALRLSEMARRAGISTSSMRRRLQPTEGSFRHSRRRALVEAAVERLRDTRVSVEAVSAELGYSDGRSFRRFIKNATGKTPQELRWTGLDDGAQSDHLVRKRLQEICMAIAL
jgi:AraC-like DNA-binding protein